MLFSRVIRAGLALGTAILLLAGCATAAPADSDAPLPAITMTSGGGFSFAATTWTISPDGSWTWVVSTIHTADHVTLPPPRQGQFTVAQQHELAVLANAPALHRELRKRPGKCEVSDGDYEMLTVGPDKFVANWCDEDRPRTKELRAKIVEFTKGT